MPTEHITITCPSDGSGGFICTMNLSDIYNGNVATFNTPFFSAGEMFISFLLVIGLILAIIAIIKSSIFNVSVTKKHEV